MAHQDFDFRPSTLTELLARRAAAQPDDLAFAFLSDADTVRERLTYADLNSRARRIAGLLRNAGASAEPVLLLYPPGLDYVAAFFGCLYAGAVAVPAYPPHRNRSLDRLRSIVCDSQARLVLCTESVRTSLHKAAGDVPDLHALRWLATDVPGAFDVAPFLDPRATADTLAFLQYTSGSTSSPKGVMLTHGNVLHNSEVIATGFETTAADVGVLWLPLYHDMGLIGGVVQPMYFGGPSYLMAPATFLSQPVRWLQAISKWRGTICGGPNFAYDLCVDKIRLEQLADLDLSHWRVAFCGAEPVRAATLERFAATFAPCGFRPKAFYPCYGLAEATLMVTGGAAGRRPAYVTVSRSALEQHRVAVVEREGNADVRPSVSCGTPLVGQRIAIVHPETLTPCPSDQPGEVWVAGASVAQGYWRRPEETERAFGARTADGDGPFLRTGDVGFLHDGELHIAGRIKDLIILHGRNLYPQDIEQTVEGCHPALRPGCGAAFTVEREGEERLVVVQELERTARATPVEDVAGAVRRAVAEQHEVQVDTVVLLRPGSTPKTSSGKIQRQACRTGFLDGTLDSVGVSELAAAALAESRPPRTGPDGDTIQCWLVEQLARKLRMAPERVDIREPLASYGLDSLTAVQITGDLEQWLGRPLSPVLVYEHPTIEALARFLAGETKAVATSPPVPPCDSGQPIAVIGMGCRFPGADGLAAFWRLLHEGVDAITEVPADRWDVDRYYSADPARPGTMNTRWGGFLKHVDQFDRSFFAVSPREAERMDPQQRLLLETSWEAFEDAGQDVARLAGQSVGVFVGISSNDYGRLQGGSAELDAYVGTGNALSVAANRLSYTFDFRGPSVAVDTACSSSLVAIHLACQSLRRGETGLAVAAGVNLILSPDLTVNFSRANMMAPDGRCKAFDAAANGYVRSEGVGVVILKPLAQALAEGDRVYAVVRGSAVNQDGRSNGLTAPNRQAQEAVLRAAYRDAGVAPADIDAVEAHGTGTSLGDPIEALALGTVLAEGRPHDRPCWLGAVKTNIGHLESAAGVAGFIKMALALRNNQLPASLHFREGNPHIPFGDLPLQVATAPVPLAAEGRPVRVGISSFGFGGTNAHVVLEAAPAAAAPAPMSEGRVHVVPISARTPEALNDLARAWLTALAESPDVSLADVAHTAGAHRTHHDYRLAIVAADRQELTDRISAFLQGTPQAGVAVGRRLPSRRPGVVFVFAGQGPQWWGMGRSLLDTEPVFRAAVARCDAAFRPLAGWSLVDELQTQADAALLDDTDRVQPLLFALQVGLAELWRAWGVVPAAVVGHSLGEVAAAHVAGALTLEDAVQVVYHRSRLQHTTSGRGRMAAVGVTPDESAAILGNYRGRLALAAVNGPQSSVWSGEPAALEEALRPLAERDVFQRVLRGRVAFHSPQMETLQPALAAALADVKPMPAKVPFYSTVTGALHDGETLGNAYWCRNLREPVQFAAAVESLIADGLDLFVELGPHPVLAESLSQCLRHRGAVGCALPSLRRNGDERATLLGTLAELYARGQQVNWERVEPAGQLIPLPHYPWQRERCWFQAAGTPAVQRNGSHGNGTATNGVYLNGHSRNGHQREYSVSDGWLVRPGWEQLQAADPPARLTGSWLVVADDPVMRRRLPERLQALGAECVLVGSGVTYTAEGADQFRLDPSVPDHWRRLLRDAFPADRLPLEGVIHLGSLSAPPPDALVAAGLTAAQERGVVGVLHLAQALVATGVKPPRLWIVTRGAQAVAPGEAAAVAQAPLWGLGRVLAHELPDLSCTLLDLDPAAPPKDVDPLLRSLSAGEREVQLAWRAEALHAARLRPDPTAAAPTAAEIRADATYLITGGLGGLGLAVARWLVDRGARSLVLTGRRGTPSEAEALLAELRGSGATIVVARADVADADQLADVIAGIDLDLPPLRGVIHAAGVLDNGIALHLTRDRLWSVLAPKLGGAWNLHALTADRPLDFFLLFSSAAALLGSPGQANYAAANAFLDALAQFRRARNLPAVSVNWGPWAERGMAARSNHDGLFAQAGMATIPLAEGLDLFGRLLTAPAPQVGVLAVEWPKWRQFLPGDRPSAYLREMIADDDAAPPPASAALDRAAILDAPTHDRPALIAGQLRELVARVLRLPAAALDIDQPLNNLGIDSLMAIELKNRIEADLGVAVPMVKFLEGPSVRDLSDFLATRLSAQAGAPPSSATSAAATCATAAPAGELDARAAEDLLARIDTLSDDQVDALLQDLYAAEKGD